jgi:DNA-directed RNA polymerase specialized sigma subunit
MAVWAALAVSAVIFGMYTALKIAHREIDSLEVKLHQQATELTVAQELNATQATQFKTSLAIQNTAIEKLSKATKDQQTKINSAESIARERFAASERTIAALRAQPTQPQTCTQALEALKDKEALKWSK